jgi:peptide/nickel transport system substrate-binding protein
MRSNPSALYVQLTGGRSTAKPIEGLYHIGLAVLDDEATLQPRLGEAVPTLENGLWTVAADGRMELVWKIRAGATWHDGVPVTAHDLLFTATVVRDQRLPEFGDAKYRYLDTVEARDERTVAIQWKQPFIDADQLFTPLLGMPMPRHLLEKTYLEDRAQLLASPYWGQEYVGTGPFRVRDWERGSHIVFDANDQYVLGRPKIDVIEVRFITETAGIEAGVLAGAIELTLGTTGLSLEEAMQVRERWKEGRVESMPASLRRLSAQFINPNPAVIADVQFRRALLHAIDRQEIIDTLEGGLTTVPASYLPPKQPQFQEIEAGVMRYDYDPQKAAQLIAGLGYTKGADGFFRDQSQQRLGVEIQTQSGDENQNKIMYAVADYWQRAGVVVDAVVVPVQRSTDAQARATRSGFYLSGGPSGLLGLHLVSSTQVPRAENNWVGQSSSRYSSPEYDALYDRYLTTVPRRERMQALARLIEHLAAYLPVLPVYFRVAPSMIANRVVGAGPEQTFREQAWNAHAWELTH